MLKKIGLSLFALAVTYVSAMAISGNQIGFPIVGGASYCGSFGNGGVCNTTIAAGPSVVTGNETVIANTNLPNGQNPQTVLFNMADLNSLPYQYVGAAATGTTTTLAATVGTLIIDPTVNIAAYGVIFPAATSLIDGQKLNISSSFTITALNLVAGTGTSISNNPTIITSSTTAPYGYTFVYSAPVTKWFRLQ